MKKLLVNTPLFLFLLPVFFVIHGLLENYGFINFGDCLLLMLTYCGAAAFLYFLFSIFYKNYIKSALMAVYCVAFYLFFGAIHDFLKQYASILSSYSVVVPLFAVIGLVLTLFLKKTKLKFLRATFFLNTLFIIYLVVDISGIVWKSGHPSADKLSVYSFANDNTYQPCTNCPRPDIYFLLFDEYASTLSLKEQHNYDNSELDSFLLRQGFSIQKQSHSNYNFTPFSMSSILNMSFLDGIRDPKACTAEDYAYCNALIRDNQVIQFLSASGYDIVNLSVFDLAGNPSRVEQNFLPLKTKLITDRTFFSQLRKDVGWMLYTGKIRVKWLTENTLFRHLENNNSFEELVEKESETKAAKPRFIYAHFYMPHPPFFFDKNSNAKPESTVYNEFKENSISGYLDYLPYVNSRLEEIISTIQHNTDRKAVIVFMGDHGFRSQTNQVQPFFHFSKPKRHLLSRPGLSSIVRQHQRRQPVSRGFQPSFPAEHSPAQGLCGFEGCKK